MNNMPESNEPIVMEETPQPDKKQYSWVRTVFEYFEMFVWCFFVILVLFTTTFRLCRVEGSSMENTLHANEPLLLYSLSVTPKQGDVVVFQLTDYKEDGERLIKRVIAVGGQTVRIDTNTNEITVDGVVYEDSHATLKSRSTNKTTNLYDKWLFSGTGYYNASTGIYEATVPEHFLFVMGDNRNNSTDSRNPAVGFVDERCVLGKAVLRFSPFTVFGGN